MFKSYVKMIQDKCSLPSNANKTSPHWTCSVTRNINFNVVSADRNNHLQFKALETI